MFLFKCGKEFTVLKSLIKGIFGERLVWAYRAYAYPQYFDVVGGPLTFKKDGLATAHNSDTLQEPLFKEAYRLAHETGSYTGNWGSVDPEYRAYIYCWAAFQCRELEGDYVECGVNKGGMARAAIHYADLYHGKKNFYLLDTYEGTPLHFLNEEERKTHNVYDECYQDVLDNFKDYDFVKIIRGEVPGTLSQVDTEKVCFISLDMNCVEPEIDAIEFFWDKLVIGGIVVLDDYNNIGHERQKVAFDKFVQDKKIKVMSLPTGQGLIIKCY